MKHPLIKYIKTLGVIVLCLQMQISFSQTGHRFADSSATWEILVTVGLEGDQGMSYSYGKSLYNVPKDTTIGMHNYQKIVRTNNEAEEPSFIRADTSGKVYRLSNDFQFERMIYDFSLNVGDTLSILNSLESFCEADTIRYLVNSVDTVSYGQQRRRLFLESLESGDCNRADNDIHISGIGSLSSFFLDPYVREPEYIPGNKYCLMVYSSDSFGKYFSESCDSSVILSSRNIEDEGELAVYPNPTKNIFNIQSQKSGILEIYSLSGKEMLRRNIQSGTEQINVSPFAEGIYFYKISSEKGELMKSGKLVKQR